VFLDAEFAMEDGLTMAGDFTTYSQSPLPACLFMASNASNQFPNAFGLVTSATAPEVCMPTYADPALSALAMVAIFDAQDLAAEENLKVAKPMVVYKESICFAIPASGSLAI